MLWVMPAYGLPYEKSWLTGATQQGRSDSCVCGGICELASEPALVEVTEGMTRIYVLDVSFRGDPHPGLYSDCLQLGVWDSHTGWAGG